MHELYYLVDCLFSTFTNRRAWFVVASLQCVAVACIVVDNSITRVPTDYVVTLWHVLIKF